ncbi:MAG: TIGR04255 family protein [Pseudomonadota bacterium]
MTSPRPEGLPDFTNPPLTEVVLGVQFEEVDDFFGVKVGKLWELFESEFPNPQEMPELRPQFETFGLGKGGYREPPKLQLVQGAPGIRHWFVSNDEKNLIQIQRDRFIQNWRKMDSDIEEYPRFEGIRQKFHENLEKLFFALDSVFGKSSREITQCEVAYVNLIYPDEISADGQLGCWSSEFEFVSSSVEGFSINYGEVIENSGGPIGRLYTSAHSEVSDAGDVRIRLELKVRGLPEDGSPQAAIDFLTLGRGLIVERFAQITSESAQRIWGRIA